MLADQESKEDIIEVADLLDIVACTRQNSSLGGKSFCDEVADLLEDGTPSSRDDELRV
jgi:hypothetical protein